MANVDKNSKQDKISISFSKEKMIEQELYQWILKQGEIIGVAGAVKQILYKSMLDDKAR